MRNLRTIILLLAVILVMGCSGNKSVETDTPEPILTPAPVVETQTVEADSFSLSILKEGMDTLLKLGADGEVIAEATLEIEADVNGNFEMTVQMSDGTAVIVTGHVKADGIIDSITIEDAVSGSGGAITTDLNESQPSSNTNTVNVSEFSYVQSSDVISCGVEGHMMVVCWKNSAEDEDGEIISEGITYYEELEQVKIVVATNLYVYLKNVDGEFLMMDNAFEYDELDLEAVYHDGSAEYRCTGDECSQADVGIMSDEEVLAAGIKYGDVKCVVKTIGGNDIVKCVMDE